MNLTKATKRFLIIALTVVLLAGIMVFWITFYQPWSERQKRPLLYSEEILKASGEFLLDPYLVTAMVYCESSFRADVISHADAVGLMQVTPATGEWIAPKVGITDFNEEMLKEPKINLRLGCWYVSWLMERYGGRAPEALTAYIAGQGDVDKWLKDPEFSNDGMSLLLDNLKGPDTRNYARKILGVREDYRRLYPDAYAIGYTVTYPIAPKGE